MTTTDLDRALHAQVMKREEEKEKRFSEEKARKDDEVRMQFGTTDMTKEELRKIVDGDRRMYYRTEELNDKLYIHYKGWRQITGLEGWTGLKALYAECNAFDRIQGLQNCRQLRSLFLSENCIRKIEGLENCPELWSLNLSSNFIERIEGLSECKKLNSLIIAKNKIGFNGVDDLVGLLDTNIHTLDIQDNKIWDPDVLPEVFAQMQDLRVLYLKGNPCSKKIPNYRKGITVYCNNLKYLDDRPVFPEDRRAAEAFNRGGIEEERAERRRIRDENNAAHDRNMKAFQDMVERARAEGREKKAMRAEDKYTDETDPVETQEKRMKRQVDEWREEHKEELRDTDKEWAQRCLANERADKQSEGAAGAEAASAEDTEDAPVIEEEGDEKKEKVDDRKLVYEDIWDDVPTLATRAASGGVPLSQAAPAPAAQGKPVFAPPSRSRTTQPSEAQPAATAASTTPNWYTRFAEVSGKKAPAASEPPAAVAAQPAPQPGAELDEMD